MPARNEAGRPGWSSVAELVAKLRKRWDTGSYLRANAWGEPFEPVRLKVHGPSAAEILGDIDAARRWSTTIEADVARHGGALRIEHRSVKGRGLGANEVPSHLVVDTFGELCTLLDTHAEVSRLDGVISHTERNLPRLGEWVRAHPQVAIEHSGQWAELLAVVDWIATNDTSPHYLRELDLEGVDTKFVERHRKILGRLLTEVLPPERVDASAGQFDRRYGFRTKPRLVRMRPLDPGVGLWGLPPLGELALRTDEVAALSAPARRVFVIENEVTYLAFPPVRDSIAIFGEGRAASTLEGIGWLARCDLVYWGDIDTHGFAILDRFRSVFPHVHSMLMDRATLLDHRRCWVTEDAQAPGPLCHLSEQESSLFEDLQAGTYGPQVRLEQERISFSALRGHLDAAHAARRPHRQVYLG